MGSQTSSNITLVLTCLHEVASACPASAGTAVCIISQGAGSGKPDKQQGSQTSNSITLVLTCPHEGAKACPASAGTAVCIISQGAGSGKPDKQQHYTGVDLSP